MLPTNRKQKQNKLQAIKPVNHKVSKSEKSQFDLYGSYTGIDFYDNFDTPIQDVDDL